MEKLISGIQQIGVGVKNVHEAWKWYRQVFGMDIRIFEESAVADLMLPYTGGEPRSRHAALALNLQGGGGFEIWQYTEREPQAPNFEIQLGDLGINIGKIKSHDVQAAYKAFKEKGLNLLGDVSVAPDGNDHFFIKDPYNNIFEVVQDTTWFKFEKKNTAGPVGAIIGVSDIEKAMPVYKDILGYDIVVYDKEGEYEDLAVLPGGNKKFRRVLLIPSKDSLGSFGRMFGRSYIELVQVLDREPVKIFKDRFWGDLGFIHLCYDIKGMDALREECKEKGFPFTVDSAQKHENTFDMGEAAGQFSYIEDPDGTLIEFVETHKMPVIKKIGWYMNVRKRDPEKPIPDWILKALSFSRVKD